MHPADRGALDSWGAALSALPGGSVAPFRIALECPTRNLHGLANLYGVRLRLDRATRGVLHGVCGSEDTTASWARRVAHSASAAFNFGM